MRGWNTSMGLAAAGVAALALVTAGALPAGPAPAEVSQPATQAASQPTTAPVDLAHLARMLGSEDFEERQKAQGMLSAIGVTHRKELENLAETAGDPEVKAGIWQRLNAIDDELALNPPPIHIELDQVTSVVAGQALRQSLGETVEFTQQPNDKSQRYTLAAMDAPFWEVVALLHDQHPLMLQRSEDDRTLLRELQPREMVDGPLGFHNHENGLVAIPMPVRRGGAAPNVQCSWQFIVANDPRMNVLRHTQPYLTRVVDNQGNLLVTNPNPVNPNWQYDQSHMWQGGVNFPMLQGGGKKIASAKGIVQVLLMVREDHVDVDPAKKPDNVVEVGGHRLLFQEVGRNGYVQVVQIDWSPLDMNNQPMPLFISLIDEKGAEVLWRPFVGNSFSSSFPTSTVAKGKIRVTVPTRTREVTWAFEIKDISLPGN